LHTPPVFVAVVNVKKEIRKVQKYISQLQTIFMTYVNAGGSTHVFAAIRFYDELYFFRFIPVESDIFNQKFCCKYHVSCVPTNDGMKL
jgi:hypothetical protein